MKDKNNKIIKFKNIRKNKKARIAFGLIGNLVLAILAFSFMISLESGRVEGVEGYTTSESVTRVSGAEYGNPGFEGLEAGQSLGQVTEPKGTSLLFGFGNTPNYFIGYLVQGLGWSLVVAGGIYLLAPLFGASKETTNALTVAAAAGMMSGFMTHGAIKQWATNPASFFYKHPTLVPVGVGIAVAVLVFILMYKKTSQKPVTFECLPWQAPVGGKNCESCNDPNKPCSEYRCKSLGQACELINKGSEDEKCVWKHPNDVSPPEIKPDDNALLDGYKYKPLTNWPAGPGIGVIYTKSVDGCAKAFTPLRFGFNTNEPAQCKIDYNHTLKYDDMQYYVGTTNLFLYNHTEQMSLPGPKNFNESEDNPIVQNGGKWILFVRCMDVNGNTNEAEYAVQFCIDPGPDTTPPEVKATSIENGASVSEDTQSAIVDFYINEPSTCKWSHEDKAYENMANEMDCVSEIYQMNSLQLYTCTTNLTGLLRTQTDFYVRCKDQPTKPENDRYTMQESYKFSLKGSSALKITNLQPNKTIFGAVSPAPVELSVQTLFGSENNKAVCYYSTTDADENYVQFYDTYKDDGIHTQRQDLTAGTYTYYYKCVDKAGNVAKNSTTFKLEIEENAPVVARVYEEGEKLKIVTVRESECVYTLDNCDFTFQEGTIMPYPNSTIHIAEWNSDKTYYIKCRDRFRNEGADCSIIVRPTKNFL